MREENRNLEANIKSLCESPFISNAVQRREQAEKVMALERKSRQQKTQITHLQETARVHHAEIVQLRAQTQEMRRERDAALTEVEQLRARMGELSASPPPARVCVCDLGPGVAGQGAALLEDRVKLFSGDGGVEAAELEQALAAIRRRREAPGTVPFLEGDGAQGCVWERRGQSLVSPSP